MAPIYIPVSAIVAGRIKIKLNVRVARIWTVADFNRPHEETFIHMLLLDDKVFTNPLSDINLFYEFCMLASHYCIPLIPVGDDTGHCQKALDSQN